MAEKTSGKSVLSREDFTKVQDADGVVQLHEVPKAWVGTRLLPDGWGAVPQPQQPSRGRRSTKVDPSPRGDSTE